MCRSGRWVLWAWPCWWSCWSRPTCPDGCGRSLRLASRWRDVFAHRGWDVVSADAPWVLVRAPGLRERLAPEGIVVRDCAQLRHARPRPGGCARQPGSGPAGARIGPFEQRRLRLLSIPVDPHLVPAARGHRGVLVWRWTP